MMQLKPFVYTAELKSFTAAAHKLGVSPAAVSKAVRKMETDLGVTLLTRTSRRVGLTPEGRVWLEHCRQALDALSAGQERLASASSTPRGQVRISASPVLGGVLAPVWRRLLERCPEVEVRCRFTDAFVSLAEDEADLALRVGPLQDSALHAQRLASCRWVTVASPGYLASAAPLQRPEQLEQHRCVFYATLSGRVAPWQFEGSSFRPRPALRLGNGNALIEAAQAGAGVVQVFRFLVEEQLVQGRLVEVLEDWNGPGPTLFLVSEPSRAQLPRIKVVKEQLLARFQQL